MSTFTSLLSVLLVAAASQRGESQTNAVEWGDDEASFLQVKIEMAPDVAEKAARVGEEHEQAHHHKELPYGSFALLEVGSETRKVSSTGSEIDGTQTIAAAQDAGVAQSEATTATHDVAKPPHAVVPQDDAGAAPVAALDEGEAVARVPSEVAKAKETVALVASVPRATEAMALMQNELLIEPEVIDNQPRPSPSTMKGRVSHIWNKDIYREPGHYDIGQTIFQYAPPKEWIVLAAVCVVLFGLDAIVLQKMPDSSGSHVSKLFIWIVVAVVFDFFVCWSRGREQAIEWGSGYVLEWMLSLDNLFLFHIIFRAYKTPQEQVHKALFVGILGAVLLRLVFFVLLAGVLQYSVWIRYPFGLMIIWSGIQTALADDDDDEDDVKNMWSVNAVRRLLGSRLHDGYDDKGCSLFVQDEAGRTQATLLFLVVACLEIGDLLFALDSVSAKVAGIPDRYIAFCSSVFAMFGLRSMFFIVEDLVKAFELLKWGLCFILVFIGAHLMFSKFIDISGVTQCIMYVSVFVVCIVGSLARNRCQRRQRPENSHETAAETEPVAEY